MDGCEERGEECEATEQKPDRSVVALLSPMSLVVPFKFSDGRRLSVRKLISLSVGPAVLP